MSAPPAKPVVLRARAHKDVIDAIDHYAALSPAAAAGLVDAVEAAYRHIGRAPGTGSPRYASELNLPGLRCWPLPRYPYLVFYVEEAARVEVWRVLHSRRDLPNWLQDA